MPLWQRTLSAGVLLYLLIRPWPIIRVMNAIIITWNLGFIVFDLLAVQLLHVLLSAATVLRGVFLTREEKRVAALKARLAGTGYKIGHASCTTIEEYREAQRKLEHMVRKLPNRKLPNHSTEGRPQLGGTTAKQENGGPAQDLLAATRALQEARDAGDSAQLVHLVLARIQRDPLSVLHTIGPVGDGGQADPTMHIEAYAEQMALALRDLRDAKLERHSLEMLQSCAVSLGQTALCLSGGGSLAMYHMGVVEAMARSHVLPRIISGASGGSIVAALLAYYTNEEMLEEIIQNDVATRFKPHVFFPPLRRQLYNALTTGFLVDGDAFEATLQQLVGDVTFEEAFRRTKRVVNIQVTSAATGTGERHRAALLLNHVTTPHVLLRSAVHASCSLPFVINQTELLTKFPGTGQIVPYSSSAPGAPETFIDGSFSADIPRARLEQLFGVTQTIVSQVNPHVVAALRLTHHGEAGSLPKHLLTDLLTDVLSRLQTLSKYNVIRPFILYSDMLRMGAQTYTGDITLLPWGSNRGDPSILAALENPDEAAMAQYIRGGRTAAFRQMPHIKHAMAVELALAECLATQHMRASLHRRRSSRVVFGLGASERLDSVRAEGSTSINLASQSVRDRKHLGDQLLLHRLPPLTPRATLLPDAPSGALPARSSCASDESSTSRLLDARTSSSVRLDLLLRPGTASVRSRSLPAAWPSPRPWTVRVAEVVESAQLGGEGGLGEGFLGQGAKYEYVLESIGVGSDQQVQTLRTRRGVAELLELHAALRALEPALLPVKLPVEVGAKDRQGLEGYLRVVLAAFEHELPEALGLFLGGTLEMDECEEGVDAVGSDEAGM